MIFWGDRLMVQKVWHRIFGMIQEMVEVKGAMMRLWIDWAPRAWLLNLLVSKDVGRLKGRFKGLEDGCLLLWMSWRSILMVPLGVIWGLLGLVALAEIVLARLFSFSPFIKGNNLTTLWMDWWFSRLLSEHVLWSGIGLSMKMTHRLLLICWMRKIWLSLIGSLLWLFIIFCRCAPCWRWCILPTSHENGIGWLIFWPSGLWSMMIIGGLSVGGSYPLIIVKI